MVEPARRNRPGCSKTEVGCLGCQPAAPPGRVRSMLRGLELLRLVPVHSHPPPIKGRANNGSLWREALRQKLENLRSDHGFDRPSEEVRSRWQAFGR